MLVPRVHCLLQHMLVRLGMHRHPQDPKLTPSNGAWVVLHEDVDSPVELKHAVRICALAAQVLTHVWL
jgi:hypothetical protein